MNKILLKDNGYEVIKSDNKGTFVPMVTITYKYKIILKTLKKIFFLLFKIK